MEDLVAYLPLLMQGLRMTLTLAISTLVLGLVLGLLLGLAKLSPQAWLSRPVFAVTNFLRGIPEFLILLVIYFGGAQALGPWGIEVAPFTAGLVALTLVFGSYASETFRGAFQSVPRGQIEAGRAYGFSGWQCFWMIELPQIWNVALPGLGNLWQGVVKDTALVSIVGLDDLMRKSNQAAQSTREPFTFYFAASVIFLAITLVSMLVIAALERRARRGVAGEH